MASKNKTSILSRFWPKTVGYKWVKLSKSACFKFFELNTSSYKVFNGLSENHKIIEIELKL